MSLRSLLKRSSQLAGPVAALLVVAAPHTAFAQASAGGAQMGEIEEVVVTAERRSVDLMEAPLAASVLSQSDIEHRGITNLDSLQFSTPSLTVNDYGGGNLLNIRGIGRTEPVTQASAGVPVYRDGLATFNAYFAASEPYFDINNIQVLRGPQGTFAGQDATGGAIFVTTNNPDPGVGGYAANRNYDDLWPGAINLPLSDTLAVRFAGDAELRRILQYSGPYTGHQTVWCTAGRASILWQ